MYTIYATQNNSVGHYSTHNSSNCNSFYKLQHPEWKVLICYSWFNLIAIKFVLAGRGTIMSSTCLCLQAVIYPASLVVDLSCRMQHQLYKEYTIHLLTADATFYNWLCIECTMMLMSIYNWLYIDIRKDGNKWHWKKSQICLFM